MCVGIFRARCAIHAACHYTLVSPSACPQANGRAACVSLTCVVLAWCGCACGCACHELPCECEALVSPLLFLLGCVCARGLTCPEMPCGVRLLSLLYYLGRGGAVCECLCVCAWAGNQAGACVCAYAVRVLGLRSGVRRAGCSSIIEADEYGCSPGHMTHLGLGAGSLAVPS